MTSEVFIISFRAGALFLYLYNKKDTYLQDYYRKVE